MATAWQRQLGRRAARAAALRRVEGNGRRREAVVWAVVAHAAAAAREGEESEDEGDDGRADEAEDAEEVVQCHPGRGGLGVAG